MKAVATDKLFRISLKHSYNIIICPTIIRHRKCSRSRTEFDVGRGCGYLTLDIILSHTMIQCVVENALISS